MEKLKKLILNLFCDFRFIILAVGKGRANYFIA